MVLASLVHHGERLRAGVDIVGIADFETFLKTTAPYRRDLRRVEYGDEREPDMLAVFAKISPLRHAERIRSALLVAHGKNDPRVPFTEAEQIAAKVRGAGREVWTVYADNEGHRLREETEPRLPQRRCRAVPRNAIARGVTYNVSENPLTRVRRPSIDGLLNKRNRVFGQVLSRDDCEPRVS